MLIDIKYTQRIFIMVIIVTFLFAGAYGLVFYSIKSKIKNVSVVVEELEKEREKLNTLDTTKRTLKQTEKLRTKLNTFFVDQSGVVDFIQKMEDLGIYSGAEVTLKNLNEKTTDGLTFSVGIDGTFSEVMHTITLLENMPYNISFTQVQVSRTAGSGNKHEWEGDVTATLRSFIQPQSL